MHRILRKLDGKQVHLFLVCVLSWSGAYGVTVLKDKWIAHEKEKLVRLFEEDLKINLSEQTEKTLATIISHGERAEELHTELSERLRQNSPRPHGPSESKGTSTEAPHREKIVSPSVGGSEEPPEEELQVDQQFQPAVRQPPEPNGKSKLIESSRPKGWPSPNPDNDSHSSHTPRGKLDHKVRGQCVIVSPDIWPGVATFVISREVPWRWYPAVLAAARSWNELGSKFRFLEDVLDGSIKISMKDLGEWDPEAPKIAETRVLHQGEITGATIELNSMVEWTIAEAPGAYDVQSIITHELGHALGLQDPRREECSHSLMFAIIKPGEIRRVIDRDIRDWLISVYGSE